MKINEVLKEESILNELERLEKVFKKNGYSQEMIEEIKHMDGANDIEWFINNLEEEQSNWGE